MQKLILIFVLLCSPAWAHRGHHHHHHHHDHHHDHEVEIEEITDGVSSRQLRALLDEAHHSIEIEEDGTFLKRWQDKFRFKTMLLNAYRWYSMKRAEPEVANAAANIVTMLLASHSIETVGGLGMAAVGAGQDVGGLTQILLTTVGVTITIPGLDPLCIVLVGAYGKWPQYMNRILTKPRVFLVNMGVAAKSLIGVPEGYVQARLAERARAIFIQNLKSQNSSLSVREVEAGHEFTVFGPHPGQEIVLRMQKNSVGEVGLAEVRFTPEARAINRVYLGDLLKPFGMNIRDFVLEIDQRLSANRFSSLEELPYVRGIAMDGSGAARVEVSPQAFPFHAVDLIVDCEGALGG